MRRFFDKVKLGVMMGRNIYIILIICGLLIFLAIASKPTILKAAKKQKLSFIKTVDASSVYPSDIITYKIEFKNRGEKVMSAKIEDSIPPGTAYLEGSAIGNGVSDGIKITWDLGTLPAGASGYVGFKVKVK